MAYLMGIDLGTSSLKVMVIDETGDTKAYASQEYGIDMPQSGYAQQQTEVWWDACCQCIRKCLSAEGIQPDMIKGVGFSGQMHGVVCLDNQYNVLRPAIIHCDARSDAQVKKIKRRLGRSVITDVILNPVYTGFLLPSLCWVRENEPYIYERISHVLLPKDYIRFKLTGVIATDYSDASATLAFDIKNNDWSHEILSRLGIQASIFPDCHSAWDVVASVSNSAAGETGLKEGTSVVCGGGDQVMQSIGNGVINAGSATVNIGSSGQVLFPSDSPIVNPKLNTHTFCSYQPGKWFTMGATMTAGLSLKWFSRLYQQDYSHIDTQTAAIQPGSGGLLFLPYLNGERTPHVNSNLNGLIIGLGLDTGMAHMGHAVMEGVAFSLNNCIEVCASLGLSAERYIASGGGARSIKWLQMQADIYNKPLYVTKQKEQAVLGAAIAAGAGCGVYGSISDGCDAAVKYDERVIMPDSKNSEIYAEYYALFKKVYRSNRQVFGDIARLKKSAVFAQ